MVIALLLACAGEGPAPEAEAGPQPLPIEAQLARVSLDLRGVRPSEDELRAVRADPAALEELTQDYVRQPGFGDRLVRWYGEVLKTQADRFITGADGDAEVLDLFQRQRYVRSVGDEPLRLLAYIAQNERPYTDYMTVDYTVANEHLLEVWPLEDLDGEVEIGWRKARYTDGRPAAGVLSTNGLWWRYTSTIENVNRSRAQAIATSFLCDRRFNRLVEFSASAGDEDLQSRTQTDPGCVSCHVVLDPLGSYLYGFWRFHPESYSEGLLYYPERERYWEDMTGIAPGFYGTPGEGLYDLGRQIAADPRYVSCAVERAWTFLMGAEPGLEHTEALTAHREEFLAGGLTLQALYSSIAQEPGYLSADSAAEGGAGTRRLDAQQLASSVAALTGFDWKFQELGMLDTDSWGVRTLAGGMDGVIVTEPATDHSTPELLVMERLSELAAMYAVQQEMNRPTGERVLFREQEDLRVLPDEATQRAQIVALLLRVHSRFVEPDDPEVESLMALMDQFTQRLDAPTSWALLLSALLRHPDFLHY